MNGDRFRAAFAKAWLRTEERQYTYGTMGKLETDGTYTFTVPGRPTFVYVTMRTAGGAQTVVPARNDGAVPHAPKLPVKMRLEHGSYIIVSKSGRGDLAITPPSPKYGIEAHAPSHQDGGTDEVATLTPAAGAIPKADPDGMLGASWLDMVESIDGATEQTTPEDTNYLPLTDTSVYKKISWANMQVAHALLYVKRDGTTPLTGDWDIGDGRKLQLERIDARDADGISLYDDNGNIAIKIVDTSNTVILFDDAHFEPYTGYDAQNNRALVIRYPTAHGTSTPTVSLVFENNQTDTTDGLIGNITWANEASANADKRLVVMRVTTDTDVDDGKFELYTYAGGVGNVAMVVMPDGDIGMGGVTAPGYALEVDGSIAASSASSGTNAALYSENDLGVLSLFYTGRSGNAAISGETLIENASANAILLNPGGGRVGIGTYAPDSKFHTVGDASQTGGWTLESSSGTAADRLAIYPLGNLSTAIKMLAAGQINFLDSSANTIFQLLSTPAMVIGSHTVKGTFDAYEGNGRMLFVIKTAVTGTAQTVVPDGAGDVTRAITGFVSVSNGTNGVANMFTAMPGDNVDVVVGGDTYRIAVAANGSITVSRTGGTNAGTIAILAIWI